MIENLKEKEIKDKFNNALLELDTKKLDHILHIARELEKETKIKKSFPTKQG